MEFCPLCKNRLGASIAFPGVGMSFMGGRRITFLPSGQWEFAIDLFDNSITNHYSQTDYKDQTQIVMTNQCNKYHFFYNGTAIAYKNELALGDIMMEKYNFTRIHGAANFSVNNSFREDTTKVRIVTPPFNTKEIVLPFVQFDFSSKKKIDSKLRNIQLLG